VESNTVGFRLRKDVWARYSAEAQAEGVPLAVHLRRRLEREDALADQLASIQRAVDRFATERHPQREPEEKAPTVDQALLLEALLLLRQLAGPQKSDLAQKELKRRGLAAWR